ncbi:hypothetical protein ACLESD_29175 [Pyxidicoccus sp. 3LFB2]
MTKRGMKWAGVVATVLVGMTAWAGAKVSYQVGFSFGSNGWGAASASLGSTRNSANSVERIGCSVYSYGPGIGGGELMHCSATDRSGTFVNCYTRDPTLVNAARGLDGDSELEFQWNAAGDCIFLRVTDDSEAEPKLP